MSVGFVYIFLNPAFPRRVKIGLTTRTSSERARELSRQTGVPADYIVLYDEFVSDVELVEKHLHDKFSDYRVHRNKEFFDVTPREAIKALQEIALKFRVIPPTASFSTDFLPHFNQYFASYLDSNIVGIQFKQLPDTCFLEVTRKETSGSTTTQKGLPLWGLSTPPQPTHLIFEENQKLLKQLNAYDWIMISDLFPAKIAQTIADEWEAPGGELEIRRKQSANTGPPVPTLDC